MLSSPTTSSNCGGTKTRITSWRKAPSAQARAARVCERCAQASCASREMPFSLAIFSALSPIESPVEYSAMAGGTGNRSRGEISRKAFSLSTSVLPFAAETTAWATGRE